MKYLLSILLSISLFSCSPEEMKNEKTDTQSTKKNLKKQSISLNDWMKNLSDETAITQISIPGSHDSGARYDFPIIEHTAKTQNLTISEQLDIGVRFLDIRCKISGNTFDIYHGAVYQKLSFKDIVSSIKEFLKKNPSEFILLSIKKEDSKDNNLKFETILEKYISTDLADILYRGSNTQFPKIQDVRGKAIMIKRFSGISNIGYDAYSGWKDNSPNSIIDKGGYSFTIQDFYDVGNRDYKWDYINQQLTIAKASSKTSQLYLNFFSGTKKKVFGIPNINEVSNFINPRALQYFSTAEKGHYGVCILDFVDAKHVSPIINTNF